MTSSVRVDITNRQKSLRVPRRWIERAVREALRLRKCSAQSLSIVVVSDEEMHSLNREFLDHDYPTDVLSFDMDGDDPLGEVIVSADTALRESEERGIAPTWELLLYVVHGVLHLTGLRDKSPEQADAMRAGERNVFDALGLDVPLWD